MSKGRSDALFKLIKAMTKGEKRYFKLAHQGADEAKYLRLFGYIDAGNGHDEERILSREPDFDRSQFSNLKAHLYGRLLKSLRDYALKSIPEMEIRALIDEAQLLLHKGLYTQCNKRLEKAENRAIATENLELQLEILKWKKQLLYYKEGFEKHDYVKEIVAKAESVTKRINRIHGLTNLHAELESLYRKQGFIRHATEYHRVAAIFNARVAQVDEARLSTAELIHLYRVYIGFHFFAQDFDAGLAYAQKWVALFTERKALQRSNPEDYIAGLNSLLIAQNKCRRLADFAESKKILRNYNRQAGPEFNPHLRIKLQKYTVVHEFNGLFMSGDFDRGVLLFERLAPGLERFVQQLDAHSRVILYYKTACLYFGKGDWSKCIGWLHRIFNMKEIDLREDIHGFARILNLISHYELGNTDLLPYQLRSTYRFLLKKQELHTYQKLLLSFMRRLDPSVTPQEMRNRFAALREAMLKLRDNPYEGRAFVYFDMIAWLDSRIEGRSMMEVVKRSAGPNSMA